MACAHGRRLEAPSSPRCRRPSPCAKALNQPGFYVVVGIGYALAFVLLSLTLRAGMPLGVAYGLWGALGVALTAVLSMLVFGEPITVLVALGIALIMAGVLLVEIGAQRAGTQDKGGEMP